MKPLDQKLLRDLWRIKGQALAIGLVISVGVLLLVMTSGLVTSLDETRRAYYERYRLADVFAGVVRAPDSLLEDLASIPGVSAVEGRVIGSALIDLPGSDLPLQAQAVSLPDFGAAKLNAVHLTSGRLLNSGRTDEILLLDSFAVAHNLKPGDTLTATMKGAKRNFQIVGLAQSPEFLYTTAPGELAPDASRFGVIWLSRTALASAYGMRGAFNQVLLSLGQTTELTPVLREVDRLLAIKGGLGAYGVAEHPSDLFISQEIDGLRTMNKGVPPIFMAVAAFLLYIVVSRIVQAEREQIGLLKAFGYSNAEVGGHYFKLILVIAAGGASVGCLAGIATGRMLISQYLDFFKFPFLIFQLDPKAFILGFLVSILAASAGGLLVLARVFSLTPATAMRPPAPADYSRSGRIAQSLNRFLDQPSRMVLRRLIRQPGRMAGAVTGMATGMALSVAMLTVLESFDRILADTFNVVDRSDVTVTFIEAMSDKSLLELQRLDGVIEVEPVRRVSAVLRHGLHAYRGVVNGLLTEPELNRAVNNKRASVFMRKEGIILADALADRLKITPGDLLTLEVREGRQPVVAIPVIGVADTLLGSPAYMELNALNRMLGEPNRISGAYLRIDTLASQAIYKQLKSMPKVAAVSLKADAREAFQKLMDKGAGAMRYVMAAIAAIITFGIVYNAARIAYTERSRDLASLRVIGFTKSEVAFVLLGELALITLIALPTGALLGYFLSKAIATGFSSDLYQVPALLTPESYGIAALAVIGAALASGWLVKRDIDRIDLISALQTPE